MTVNDIQNLIDLLNETPEVAEISVTAADGSEVSVKRRASAYASKACGATAVLDAPASLAETIEDETPVVEEPVVALSVVASTMVGIFHTARPAVEVGTELKAGQRVGSIESIKLMNDVVSTCTGTVAEVLIADGQPVEYGQVLYRVATQPII